MARGFNALRAALGAVTGVAEGLQQRELLKAQRQKEAEELALRQLATFNAAGMRVAPIRTTADPAAREAFALETPEMPSQLGASRIQSALSQAATRGTPSLNVSQTPVTGAGMRLPGMALEPQKPSNLTAPISLALDATPIRQYERGARMQAANPAERLKVAGIELGVRGPETDEEKAAKQRDERNAQLQQALAALPESDRERLEPIIRASFAGVPSNVLQTIVTPREAKQPWAKEGFATEKEYLDYKRRERQATALPKEDKESGPRFGEVASLRKEFNTESRPYKTINDALKNIEKLGTKANPTPQDLQALVYQFVKVQDPTSVVRESEYANAANAAALSDKIENFGRAILAGQRLTPKQRQDMVQTARLLREEAMSQYSALANSYEDLAGSFGMNPKTIIPNRLDRDIKPAKDSQARLPGETAAQFLARTGGKR